MLVQEIAARIEKEGGYSLLIDYGHDGTKSDTFRVCIYIYMIITIIIILYSNYFTYSVISFFSDGS